ncbi:MAG: pyruvate dehydrogenase [Pseudonocardiaceae bacterium]|nr:pyruvate dehydrogenase [Pseudonocardiaceae bacterium]
MTRIATHRPGCTTVPDVDDAALAGLERRVRWLATSIVHHANHRRGDPSGLKVGGHQASCASMTSMMTALWFGSKGALGPQDRVSVKPHASPVLHAINHLLGEVPAERLTGLRQRGGLQSYPSRTKDPGTVDFSTGSVGIGATATIWAAFARRYLDAHFGGDGRGRMIALVGDAELDEGAVWEAVHDPQVAELGELLWVVDFNRQSLDRVVPGIAYGEVAGMFGAAGWEVRTCKYGPLLTGLFAEDGGELLRERIDTMPNEEYQRLLRSHGDELRTRLAGSCADPALHRLLSTLDPEALPVVVRDLGGHDMGGLDEAFAGADPERPTVVFAYTIKGYGLPTEGHPANHSALLTPEQYAELAAALDTDPDDPWASLPAHSPEARLCAGTARRLRRDPLPAAPLLDVPVEVSPAHRGVVTTQATLGRVLADLRRNAPELAARIVTVSPDVASSTNLAGWLNKVEVYTVGGEMPRDWFADDPETLVHWAEAPVGQHVELGIAEGNLVGLLGELGSTWSRWAQPLVPIGVLYDPFVGRALEPWGFGTYAGGQSILIGTPSGVSLAPEGGAHQSVITPSIGLEHPGVVAYEPAFAVDLEWTLLHAMRFVGRDGGCSAYFRLSTIPVDQVLAAVPADAAARERRRSQTVRGGYVLRSASDPAAVVAAVGAAVPGALEAAQQLAQDGIETVVVVVTSADLLFRATRARSGMPAGCPGDLVDERILDELFDTDVPLVTVLDGHPHTLAFLGTVRGVPTTTLGVTEFGQSAALADSHALHGIDAPAIRGAVLDLAD